MKQNKWKELRKKNEKNLKRLVSCRYGSYPKHSVINLSSYTLEEKDLNALSYGLNFAIPTKKVNKELTYLGFESFLNQVSGLKTKNGYDFNTFKANLVAIAHNYTKTIPEKKSVYQCKRNSKHS